MHDGETKRSERGVLFIKINDYNVRQQIKQILVMVLQNMLSQPSIVIGCCPFAVLLNQLIFQQVKIN